MKSKQHLWRMTRLVLFSSEHCHRWTSKCWMEMKRKASSWLSASTLLPILDFIPTSCRAESAPADHTQQVVYRVGLYTQIKDNILKTWQCFIHIYHIHSHTIQFRISHGIPPLCHFTMVHLSITQSWNGVNVCTVCSGGSIMCLIKTVEAARRKEKKMWGNSLWQFHI